MTIRKFVFMLIFVTLLFGLGMTFYYYYMTSQNPLTPNTVLEKTGILIIEPSTKEPLRNPIDLAVTENGQIFITDSDHHCIQAFDRNGKFLLRFGEYGSGEGKFDYPVGIVSDAENNLYVAELYNQRISVFNSKGEFKYFIKVSDAIPTAIAIDLNNNLYIVSKSDNTIKKFNRKGEVLMSFGGFGNSEAMFQYPLGLAVGKDGNIYVSDTGNNRVQVFDPAGKLVSVTKVAAGPPSGIAVNSKNNIYYTEPINGQVMSIENGNSPEMIIDKAKLNDDGLFFPEGIEVNENELFLIDKGNNRILIYQLDQK